MNFGGKEGKITSSMHLLAVDTTSAHGSVALVADDAVRGLFGLSTSRPEHAERLIPSVDYLLKRTGARLDEVEAFAVASGPGSFTGLRIGIAAVEGLAYTLGRPAVAVSVLEATAYKYRHCRGRLLCLLDAYRGEVYGAVYQSDGESVHLVGEPTCEAPEAFLEQALSEPATLVAGSGTLRHRPLLDDMLPEGVTIAKPSFFLAEEIARLGRERLLRGEHAPLGGLDAFYIRPPEAVRNRMRESQT